MIPAALLRLLSAGALLLAAGCSSVPTRDDFGPVYEPANFRGAALWPESIRRVAVLPTHDASGSLSPEFTARYDSIWRGALDRTHRAEFISVPRPTAQTWFGKPTLAASDLLPNGLLGRVARETGAQAVLFLDITQSKSYPPLVLSFRTRLIDTTTGETVWMADEIFDSAHVPTARAARRHARANSNGPGDHGHGLLQSPTRFADYAFQAITTLLPPRTAPAENISPAQPATQFPVRADR